MPLQAHMFQIDETLEAAIQFGYITLISSFFELAPLLCLINNIFELRIDAFKLVTSTRMPEPTKSLDILWCAQTVVYTAASRFPKSIPYVFECVIFDWGNEALSGIMFGSFHTANNRGRIELR